MDDLAVWLIGLATIFCVLGRPFQKPEWVWATLGALALFLFGLESWGQARHAFLSGLDVYFFLIGMMFISETAREAGVFDWLADLTTRKANGSPFKLFTLIYLTGVLVTIFLSNDATAVVLTPAVYACARRAKVDPLPALFACALVANAASFVLPISNPANLVVYRDQLPALADWVTRFALPSLVSIFVTFALLALVFRKHFSKKSASAEFASNSLSRTGRVVLGSIIVMSAVLLFCSAKHIDLGLPTFICGAAAVALVSLMSRSLPRETFKHVSWGVIPMVGGLFIVVDAVNRVQVLDIVTLALETASKWPVSSGRPVVALAVGALSNIVNNLPLGLTVGEALRSPQISEAIRRATLIGIDLGPNLSVTGSLATLLWLIALRRENVEISAWQFLKVGVCVTPIALFLTVVVL